MIVLRIIFVGLIGVVKSFFDEVVVFEVMDEVVVFEAMVSLIAVSLIAEARGI